MRFFFLCLLLAASFSACRGRAETLTAQKILNGDTILLNDGRTLHLQGVKAIPNAHRFLRSFLDGKDLTYFDGVSDRYDRIDAQLYASKGDEKPQWLQGELLSKGLAFIYPPTGHEARLAEMYDAENTARKAHMGLWEDTAFADSRAENPAAIPIGKFVFVTGKVVKAERVKDKFYLNFGDNWRDDFTVAIAARDLKLFRKEGIDPANYAGQNIRVRGWVIRNFGPMIVVTHPGQIGVL